MTTIPGTTPYAWPYDGQLEPRRTAVLRVTTGRATGAPGPERLHADEIAASVRERGGTVIHVVTVPPPPRASVGAAGAAGAADAAGDTSYADATISSRGVDGFYGSALDAVLRGSSLDRLILVGDGLETCIHSTMRSANDRGYECLLVLDACRPHDPSLVQSCRSQIEMSGGIFGAVGLTQDVLTTFGPIPPLTTERAVS